MLRKKIVSILLILFIISTVIIYAGYLPKKVTSQKENETSISIDNQISPLENQGVVLEILRIRNRGILEKLLTPGHSWKNKPSFYFITTMDGLEYISKDVTQHGRTTEMFFTTWDSMFQENKIMKDVPEEQETSAISLTIMEKKNSGLLGLKTQYVQADSMSVIYDFRTGRWSGQDSFKDRDGYGYYLGENYEIWFNIYQIDYDGDFIPYWIEVNILGTDPTVDDSTLDPDGDGIPTTWEWKWGYDPFTWDDHANLDPDLDGIDNIEEYQMRRWFADPFIQNIYYEVDYMERGGPNDPPHFFYEETKEALIERYAEHNIKVFFDDGWPNSPINGGGQQLPHIAKISLDSGMVLQYYNNYFPDERKGIFRYLILGHGGGFQSSSKNNIIDTTMLATVSSRFKPIKMVFDFILSGKIPTERGKRISLGSLIMHEMGHSCSITDWTCAFEGIDNISYGVYVLPNKEYVDTWGQYQSVMNYLYANNPKIFDYSDGSNGPPYDQNDWGYMFVGWFQYNSEGVMEPHGGSLIRSEWMIPGYALDINLTNQFVSMIGTYSPIDPIPVNWSVYRAVGNTSDLKTRQIKVFAQPAIKTTQQWVLYTEGNVDVLNHLHFYSYTTLIDEKMR